MKGLWNSCIVLILAITFIKKSKIFVFTYRELFLNPGPSLYVMFKVPLHSGGASGPSISLYKKTKIFLILDMYINYFYIVRKNLDQTNSHNYILGEV